MADKKKRTPFDALTLAGILIAALCLVGGAVLTIWPGESFTYLYYAVIAVILLLGAVKLPGVFRDPGAPRHGRPDAPGFCRRVGFTRWSRPR